MESILFNQTSGVVLGKAFMTLMTMVFVSPAFNGGNTWETIRSMSVGSGKKIA